MTKYLYYFMLVLLVGFLGYCWCYYFVPRERIFSESEISKTLRNHGAPQEYWTPNNIDIHNIKDALSEYVAVSEVGNEDRLYPIDSYSYQYYGVIKGGDKFISITAFCTGLEILRNGGRHSIEKLVVVYDGGSCYFNAGYNLKTKTISSMFIH